MDLSILVVSWNTCDLTRRCLESIYTSLEGQRLQFEVIVVDNGSSDGSAELTAGAFACASLICNTGNRGFAAANNQGIGVSRGRHVLLLNSDAILVPGAAETMVDFLDRRPEVGAVGARLVNADGSFQASFADFPTLLSEVLLLTKLSKFVCSSSYPSYSAEQSTMTRAVDWVIGACLMMRRRVIDEVGGLDEGYFMYTEETDWCFRVWKAGWQIYYLPDVVIPHWSGRSASNAPERKRTQLYRSKSRFFHQHRHPLTAITFDGALRAVSILKYGGWILRSLICNATNRERARQHVEAYRVLMNEL